MTIFYRVRFVEGSLFLRGQVVAMERDPQEPLCFTFDIIRRIAKRRNVTKVWFELN